MQFQDECTAIGKRLQAARQLAMVSQGEAASAAGVARTTVSNWEAGRNMPNLLQFRELVALYGVNPHPVLFGSHLWELTPGETKTLRTRMETMPDDLRNKLELLLALLARHGADRAEYRQAGPDFAASES